MPGEQLEPPAAGLASRGLRLAGVATWASLVIVVILIALTIAFPILGIPPSANELAYFPPQMYFLAAFAPLTTLLGFITGVLGISRSWRARRYGWVAVFAALVALLVGPAYLSYGIEVVVSLLPYPQGLPAPDLGLVTVVSGVTLALISMCGLFADTSARPAH